VPISFCRGLLTVLELRRTAGSKRWVSGGLRLSGRERALLVGGGVALAIYLLMAWWAGQSISALDTLMRDLVHLTRHPVLNAPVTEISRLGAAEGLIPLILLGSLVLWRQRPGWAIGLPVLMAGTGALQFLAKWSVDRPRPNLAPWGFPSGHMLSLVVFFGLVAYLISMSGTSRPRRRLVVALCPVPVTLVAYSRLYLDAHWLTDLAGGLTVGLAYLLLALLLVEMARTRRTRVVDSSWRSPVSPGT
jgi:membrane-associated phospholipid phosphatase